MKWLPVAGCVTLAAIARAETINWFNPQGQVNLTSSGLPMDGLFQFQLGVFTDGFTPTRRNLHKWALKWHPAMQGNYNPVTKAFDEDHTVVANPAPFLANTNAYIWGRRAAAGGDEWILFRKSAWRWPTPNPMNPFPLVWNAAEADQVVIGSINGPVHVMKSESVASYSQWQGAELAGEILNAPGDDPDDDGVPNLLEFVFGLPPKVAGPPPAIAVTITEIGGQNFLKASIPRLSGRVADLTVMVSGDLTTWHSGPEHTVEISSDATSWVVRDLTPLAAGEGRRFMKLRAIVP